MLTQYFASYVVIAGKIQFAATDCYRNSSRGKRSRQRLGSVRESCSEHHPSPGSIIFEVCGLRLPLENGLLGHYVDLRERHHLVSESRRDFFKRLVSGLRSSQPVCGKTCMGVLPQESRNKQSPERTAYKPRRRSSSFP